MFRANAVERDLITLAARPRKGVGLCHLTILEEMRSFCKRMRWAIREEKFALSRNKLDCAICLTVDAPEIATAKRPERLLLGITTSRSGHAARRVYCGETLEGGAQILLGRVPPQEKKHHLSPGERLWDTLERFPRTAWRCGEIFTNLRTTHISAELGVRLGLSAGRAKILPWSRAGKLCEFTDRPMSALHLYLRFLDVLHRGPPTGQMAAAYRFRCCLLRDHKNLSA